MLEWVLVQKSAVTLDSSVTCAVNGISASTVVGTDFGPEIDADTVADSTTGADTDTDTDASGQRQYTVTCNGADIGNDSDTGAGADTDTDSDTGHDAVAIDIQRMTCYFCSISDL